MPVGWGCASSVDVLQELQLGHRYRTGTSRRAGWVTVDFLDEAVPRAAPGALPRPLRVLRPAVSARGRFAIGSCPEHGRGVSHCAG